jgi:RNA polymerase sigma factor (sigma-70 family)
MNYKLLNDAELVDLMKANDDLAFREIYLRYWKELLCSSRKKVNDAIIAEELVQNVFVSLWDKRKISEIKQLQNYIHTALRYCFINYVKKQIVAAKYLDHKKNAKVDYINHTEESFALKELSTKIEESICHLPAKTGQIFRMSRYENRSVREISDYFKITDKAVEYHITQSLKTLKNLLKDFIVILLLAVLK